VHGQRIGYIRISSFDQNPDRQLEHVAGLSVLLGRRLDHRVSPPGGCGALRVCIGGTIPHGPQGPLPRGQPFHPQRPPDEKPSRGPEVACLPLPRVHRTTPNRAKTSWTHLRN
jgi:hypothetical protein